MGAISKFTVRTSGRRVFRRCLRKWGFQSSMRMNLQRKGTEQNINFWFGSAIHFAMEDHFGYNRFGDLVRAFQAYYAAFPASERPEGADMHYYLGTQMLDYFQKWYERKNVTPGFQTVWLNPDGTEAIPGTPNARPLVEESFILNLGVTVWVREDTEEIVYTKEEDLIAAIATGKVYYEHTENGELRYFVVLDNFEEVTLHEATIYYHGTLDRVVKDRQGRWWIMDWKTAKSADTNKLDTDDQISAYLWAAEQWFGRPIHGFMYVQLTKDVPKPPKRLSNGTLSVDKKQKTTYDLFKQALISDYGDVRKAPNKLIDYLNYLADQETPEGDRFVRWDMVTRTSEQKVATFHHIMGELKMMLDPDLYLFPNPTRDCIWDCAFRDACLMMDNGKHEEAATWLNTYFEPRPREEDGNIDEWRKNIPWPDTPMGSALDNVIADLELNANTVLDIILPDKYKDEEDF